MSGTDAPQFELHIGGRPADARRLAAAMARVLIEYDRQIRQEEDKPLVRCEGQVCGADHGQRRRDRPANRPRPKAAYN